MADEERLGQRDWGGDTAALGGYGSAGLYSRRRQMERTTGGSFLNISDAPNTGGVGGGYVRMPSVGPESPTVSPRVSGHSGSLGPQAMAQGVAPDFSGQIPQVPNWGQTGALLGRMSRAGVLSAVAGFKKTDKDDGGNTVADQPWGPPDPTQRRDNPWAAPDPKDNRTYTTGDSPMTMADSADPFIGPDTDELGRPLRDISNKGVAPWGPPTGAPKHGPIFLGGASGTSKGTAGDTVEVSYDLASTDPSMRAETPAAKSRREQVYASRPQSTGRTLSNRPGGRRGSGGATTEAPTQSWAPPSAADYVEPATPNEASIARDAEDPMGFFVDNSGNELPRPQATAPQSRREQVYASRPQSLGREVVGSPFRPNSVMAQRRAAAEQAQVEQVSTSYEYPNAAPRKVELFDQDAPSSEGSLLFSPEEQAQMDADNASFAAGTAALEAETAAMRRRNQEASRGGSSRSRSRSRRQIPGQQQFDV